MRIYLSFFLLSVYTAIFAQVTFVNQPIINTYAAVTEIDFCKNAMSLANNAEINFSVGDRVLIVQMKGAGINTSQNSQFGQASQLNAAGSYEFNEIKTINFGSINGLQFEYTLSHPYTTTGKVQVIKVPQYQDVVFQSTLTCLPWDGAVGGILVFEASGNVSLQANINLESYGLRGGDFSNDGNCYTPIGGFQGYACIASQNCGGFKGEGLALEFDLDLKGRGRNVTGGGGGNDHNAGGGGGGNGGNGGNGANNDLNTQFCDGGGGFGGQKIIANTSNNRIIMGGAGGAGDSNNNTGTPGAASSGTLIVKANSFTANGFSIISNGLSAASSSGDGAGGGGAGGSVYMDVVNYTDLLAIELNGGNGGNITDNGNCPAVGGGGAGGQLWLAQAALPANVSLSALGGSQGTYTSVLCSSLNSNVGDGEDGSTSFGFEPFESSNPFIETRLIAGTDAIICAGNETPLSANVISSVNPTFSWNYNGSNISSNLNENVAPTTRGANVYTARLNWSVFDQSCIVEENVTINVRNPDITIVASPNTPVEIGAPVFLNAVINPLNPNYVYEWAQDYVEPNDSRNSVVEPFESTQFCINVTDELSCEKEACIFVPVILPFSGAPDAFSPNGDGLNDVFKIFPEAQLKQTRLKIYNRWGDLLYESGDVFEWNGTVEGKKQAADTYIWVATFQHRNTGETSMQSNYITLIP